MKTTSQPYQQVFPLTLSNERQGVVAILAAMMLWGTTYVAAKFALHDISPMTTAFIRFMLACLIAWPILLVTHGVQPVKREFVGLLISSGLFQTTLYFALQYTGMRFTTASNTSLIVNSRPIVIAIFGLLFLHEHLSGKQWGGLFLAFIGVIVLIGGQNNQLPPTHYYGDFLIVLNAISGAIGIICAKRILTYLKPFTALVYQISIGALGLLPLALLENGWHVPKASFGAWSAILYMAVFCTVISQMLVNMGLTCMPASKVAPFFFIAPLLNVVFAYFLLGEPITWALAAGGMLIMIGTLISNRIVKPKEIIMEEAI